MSFVTAPKQYPMQLLSNPQNKTYFLVVVSEPWQKGWQAVLVPDLLKTIGHQETTNLFKSFGKNWMTKEGCVFYPLELQKLFKTSPIS